jgi:hypothetical protein
VSHADIERAWMHASGDREEQTMKRSGEQAVLEGRFVAFVLTLALVACGGTQPSEPLDFDTGPGNEPADGSFGGNNGLDVGGIEGGTCVPQTCVAAGANCGPIGDGCGGLVDDCGVCPAGTVCGGGGTPSVCGTSINDGGGCIPLTCDKAGANCGPIGDGCGGKIECGVCTGDDTCGGGGVPSVCGHRIAADDGGVLADGGACVPRTCASVDANCGPIGDGCGGELNCGTCSGAEICGGAGPSKCGNPHAVDGAACRPRTCADVGANCGPIGDGCGGKIECGTCSAPFICGGGGIPSVCGNPFADDAGTVCKPRTCEGLGANCGPIADGCGGLLNCGTCSGALLCGGGGTPNRCGNPFADDAGVVCKPKTCADLGAECGAQGDGCGGVIASCGACAPPAICGGGGAPSKCGGGTDAGSGGTCTGLCARIPSCPTGTTTTIEGTVYAPTPARFGSPDPIYNAVVYVPKDGTVGPFPSAITCDRCAASVPPTALVSAVTGPDGKFVLRGVPAGANVPLVIEIGRWRRFVTIPNVSPCNRNLLTAQQTRLPRKRAELDPRDDIPRFAIATGYVDALECVLRKIGIDDSEFTRPEGNGRVHLYLGNGARIGNLPQQTQSSVLFESPARLASYDSVLLACEGEDGQSASRPTGQRANLFAYANAGGRVFATHWNYRWLRGANNENDAITRTATWNTNFEIPSGGDAVPLPTLVDTSFPKGVAFEQWLGIVGALVSTPPPPHVDIYEARRDVTALGSGARRWLYSVDDPATRNRREDSIQHFTFNTPVGLPVDRQCGRVIFSDFHVRNAGNARGDGFPANCKADAPLSPQEKTLEFMIFDLSSCIGTDEQQPPPPPPTCTPRTCSEIGARCGQVGDGCGGLTPSCGTCPPGQTCGGGGRPYECGGPTCAPKTCAQLGLQCGPAGDGCGGTLQCGTCPPGQTCGGGGVHGICGGPSCTPIGCAAQNAKCGYVGDGCGASVFCGTCPPGETCGGGGVPNECGGPKCTPRSCAAQAIECGPAGDGCGGRLFCGECVGGKVCGGGGIPGKCGNPNTVPCKPRTCADQKVSCGPAGDGCGGALDCGTCVPPETCGGGGEPGVCGAPKCTPRTCAQYGAECGTIANGCGGLLDCGICPPGKTCGGGGIPYKCGGTS